jgi:ADP-ribose pyrophosphatase
MKEITELAGNLIIEEGELLLLFRPDEEHWEVPGGKVEEDESPTEAAKREAEEEIGVEVELEKPFYSGEFQHDERIFLWHGYLASIKEERPEIQEDKFGKLEWFSYEELPENLAPNLKMIKPGLENLLSTNT